MIRSTNPRCLLFVCDADDADAGDAAEVEERKPNSVKRVASRSKPLTPTRVEEEEEEEDDDDDTVVREEGSGTNDGVFGVALPIDPTMRFDIGSSTGRSIPAAEAAADAHSDTEERSGFVTPSHSQ